MKIGKHKGKTMYYAQADKARVIPFEEIIKDIAEMSSLTTGDVRNAIDRLAYYLKRGLAEGNTVQLGQIGTFRMNTASKFVETPEEVNVSILKEPKVQFVLNSHLKEAKDSLRVAVFNPYTQKKSGNAGTDPNAGGGTTDPNAGGGSNPETNEEDNIGI